MTSINGGQGLPVEEPSTVLYVGQHETQRSEQVSLDLLRRAQDLGYDLLTAPITTPKFQSRVLELLESQIYRLETSDATSSIPLPIISPLSPEDSDLVPEDSNTSLIAVASPWIDIGSLDPLVAHVSQQVFILEVAYAAFCGVSNVLVHGPTTSEGTVRFARSALEALGLGPYVHLHILMPMTGELEQDVSADGTHLAEMHLQYMRHLQQSQPSRPPIERFGQGYQDYMQSPLQPLTDNLESITYEVFEKDPVKYEWYERAVALALKDLRALLGDERQIIVAVAGAGRGPLVTRVLQASRKTGINVKCYAVEKNPNAHLLLQRRNATDPLWANQVTVVASDMRSWPGPTLPNDGSALTKTDLLVSELLGSFADNELSPECLDGVQHVLHPGHGISIPQSYSAHLTPIASPRLHSDLLSRASTDISLSVSEKWEIPYVVMLHQFDYISTAPPTTSPEVPQTPDVQQAWSFSHPVAPEILAHARQRGAGGTVADTGTPYSGPTTNDHNARSCTLRFACADRGVCHGLAGYFETVLYSSPHKLNHNNNNNSEQQTVELSTNPVTMAEKSKDMISWFPIFFPLKTPLHIPDGGEMEVSMWRQTDDRKVWYEWVVEVYMRVPVGEGGSGKRMRVGISELHSSRRNGCMM
ncbi:hypothetical protein B0A54_13416 [Friedmanniomyces endolithicus]|uniref:Protein arginine N-methyltransferase n=1 Tax=Friedmanniomyces endolithicus TaxID=329885 RepID=A0A4U0UIQ6_9PEZI|nr:hypothetical protein B0A54_13416 [Friedmanniomyces endolithicus]